MEKILEEFKIYLLETGEIHSKMTLETYRGNVKQLLRWLKIRNTDISELGRVLILKYLEYLKTSGYKANTFNTKINSITNFNNYLKDQGIIDKNIVFPKDKIQLPTNKKIEVFTDEEMDLIEAYIESGAISPRDSLAINILKSLGLRVSELTQLKLEDIDVVGLEVEVLGKNNKRRLLPMKISLANDIRAYISKERKDNKYSSSPYLFVSERSAKLHRNTILEVVKKMGKELGIEQTNCHKFRHSLATNMANRNVPIHLVQAFLVHVQLQTTID